MLIKVWQPRIEKDGSAPLCVFEGATGIETGWHGAVCARAQFGHQASRCRLNLITLLGPGGD
jgi:hypothetical protein